MHVSVKDAFTNWFSNLRERPKNISYLGAYDINGGISDITKAVGFDVVPGRGVDVVIHPGEIPIEHRTKYDLVVSISSFQFCPDPAQYRQEIIDLLEDGGSMFLTMCGWTCNMVHSTSAWATDCIRMSPLGLKMFFEPYFNLESDPVQTNGHPDLILVGRKKTAQEVRLFLDNQIKEHNERFIGLKLFMERKLAIGCGSTRKPGQYTIDADPRSSPDLVASVPPLPSEILSKQWDEVEILHAIEHVYPWEAEQLLSEVYQVLKEGGKLILEQPNIEFCAKVYLGLIPPVPGTTLDQCSLWGIYGDWNHRNPLMMHKFGYTPKSITALLTKVGFEGSKIEIGPGKSHVPDRDFHVIATK